MEKIGLSYSDMRSVQVHISDDSDIIDSSSDERECIDASDEQATETSKLIQIHNVNKADAIYRRGLNANSNAKFLLDNEDLQYFHQQKARQSQNRTSKQFLFLFGFATTVIILSQLYLSLYYHDPLGIATLPGWDRNKTRSIPFYILPDVNTTIIEPPLLCKTSDPILILIVVCSAVDNFETRQTLRETWANTTEFNYSKFSTIHANFYGKYLSFNYPNWRNYTVKNQNTNSFADVTVDEYGREIEDSNAFWDSSQADFQIKVAFLVGQTENNETQAKIVEESQLYNDMIQESFLDTYNNLTLKTIMMLKWVNSNCMDKVKFLMKCDDDTFVNVPNLIQFLLGGTIPVYNAVLYEYNDLTIRTLSRKNRLGNHKDLLIGSLFCHSKPIGNTSSKWFAPQYMYDKKIYPNYLSGTGYVMTMNTAIKLYNVSLTTPLFHLEDVYLTGICSERAKIKPKNYHLFNYLSYKDLCEFRGMITKHEIQPNDMKKAYDSLLNTNITCTGPTKNAKVRKVKNLARNCS